MTRLPHSRLRDGMTLQKTTSVPQRGFFAQPTTAKGVTRRVRSKSVEPRLAIKGLKTRADSVRHALGFTGSVNRRLNSFGTLHSRYERSDCHTWISVL